MRIDTNRAGSDAVSTVKTDATDGAAPGGTRAGRTGQADSVQLSSSVQLASEAERAAREAPDVRPGEVERATKLLGTRQIGTDPFRLADALINITIDEH